MYSIGDKIVHPMHGAGIIEDITTKNIDGKSLDYYVLKLPVNNMTVMVPVASTVNIGIRVPISSQKADELISLISTLDIDDNQNWNKRFRDNSLRVKSGNLKEVMRVIKSLMFREYKHGLSNGERKMLHLAKQIFISEIVITKNVLYEDVEAQIDSAINALICSCSK